MAINVTDEAAGAEETAHLFEVRSPADDHVVAKLPVHSPREVAAMAAELRAAQPAWEALGPEGRGKHLLAWLDWLMDNEQRILGLVHEEAGKSWGDTSIEITVAVEVINYHVKHAAEFLADESFRPHGPASLTKRLRVHYRPHQLVGVISPWNYPFAMPMMDVPGALMAGATVLTKPSEVTPVAWAEAVRGWREEIGAPPVLACATGLGETGAAVVDNVDMIQFTGSTRTGRKIAVRAAERLIPASLELGGKDAMIVLDDADLDRAVGGAVWAGFFNSGQSCISTERLYVQDGIYDAFLAKLRPAVEALRVGHDAKDAFATEYGAMATADQLALVERHVQDAVDKGARVLTGGKRVEGGLFYEPTILVDVDHTMDCMRDETFGPTLPVMRVRDEEEAIALANDSRYGLAGSVFSSDAARAERVARRLETGAVNANNAMTNVFQFPVPMGGWGESGMGHRFGGADGVRKYCRTQTYVSERVAMASEPHWYPYSKRRSKLMARAVRLLGMHDWKRRLGRSR